MSLAHSYRPHHQPIVQEEKVGLEFKNYLDYDDLHKIFILYALCNHWIAAVTHHKCSPATQ